MFRRFSTSLMGIVALTLMVNIVCYAQSQAPLTRHVREATISGEARSLGHLPATQTMRLVLALPIRDQAGLDDFLNELYDSSSESYRHFLTVEEFTARFGPSQEDYDAVIRFAEANGLTVVGTSRNRLNVDVIGSVGNIEEAFHLTLGVYLHPSENRVFYAPDREPTPDLAVRLWHISGLDNYSVPRPAIAHRETAAHSDATIGSNATIGSGPGGSFLGSDMRAAYYGGTLTGTGQSLGLLEYYGTDLADLNTYYSNVGQTRSVPITLKSTDGTSTSCVSPSCDDTEQTIDMTQALGMAPGMSRLVMYVGSTDAAIFNAMATASPLNAQLSSSWTWFPADPDTDKMYFQEFAAQGQNLFQAAGDSGAWTPASQIYPADDVYVTSVGGTDLRTSSAGGPWSSETAWLDGGGGISPDKYAIPSWQTSTASGCSSCSKIYRDGPDVSANADFTFYVCADQTTCSENYYGGTSFAAPMWAGYLALTNQQAIANGNPPLGFINPTLYSIGLGSSYDTDFHDITSGSNGYPATTGYDLATGWGSPNGVNLVNALAGTSTPGFSLSASPTSVSVARGSSGQSTITSTVTGGFSSAVSLSATGQPTGVTVGFNPTSITGAGTSTMTMTVAASTATGTYAITVTGTSGAIVETTSVSLTVSAGPAVTLSPTSLGFGYQVINTTSAAKTVVLTNSGGATLTISSIATGAPFAISSKTCGSSLGVGAKCKVYVTFTPTVLGKVTGTLTSTDNASNSPQTVPLSGNGVEPAVLTPARATYAAQALGTTSTAKIFTLTNYQTVAMTSIAITTSGDFAVSATTCTTSLAAKSKCTISVTFKPTATGTRTGKLSVSDSASNSPQTSNLTGKGN